MPNGGRGTSWQTTLAIEINAVVDFSDLRDIALQASVGCLAAAAPTCREL